MFPVEVSSQLVKISGKEYILAIDRDITERKKMEDKLVHQSLYDSLTGLPNRILFMDRLKTNFARKKRQQDILFSLLFIDIDHFKKINDSYGHIFGDELLVDVVERLRGSIRPGDTLSRFGGDEFLLILEDLVREEDAISIIERIQDGMKHPFRIGTVDIYATLSIGISFSNIEYHKPEDMLRDTDNAMYHAKEQGRSCYVVFDRKMHHSSIEALKMENDLRRAVSRNEFILHYQPVVDINTLKITGFEALIRWEHPVYGMLYPDSFIGIAESTGLITEIGTWALYEACGQISRWKKMFPDSNLVVSVNLSVKQFNHKLPDLVAEIVKESGIEPENLRLEITESIMMKDIDHAHAILTRLKELDVRIYVDDFGTGYSSLNYIHKFPVDALKIDKSFVENIMHDDESLEVVRAVSTIARNLNLNLIAEGIENEEQLEILRSLNCNLTQGFHFGIPLNGEMSEEYMHEFASRYK
jgi:diguanylate cyclase (GGDEF)-like protein